LVDASPTNTSFEDPYTVCVWLPPTIAETSPTVNALLPPPALIVIAPTTEIA
jgi:hypothetical protein